MLITAKHMGELSFGSLMEIYEEGSVNCRSKTLRREPDFPSQK